jgi:hypothetical protein
MAPASGSTAQPPRAKRACFPSAARAIWPRWATVARPCSSRPRKLVVVRLGQTQPGGDAALMGKLGDIVALFR